MKYQLIALITLCACATARTTQPPRLSGSLPLQMTVRGSAYAGTAILDGKMQGTFTVRGPVEVIGTVAGRTAGDSSTLDLTYSIAANGCRGTMKLQGTFVTGSNVVQGNVEATDSCVGRMTGTFRMGQ